MRRLLLPGLLSLFCTAPVRAQSLPVLSQNPPALRWQEVRTPHFRVLYAGGIDTAAQRTAARLERLHGPDVATLGVSPRPISVVLQNQTTVPNGFVTFLPRHAEFFTTPQQGFGLGTVDWLDGLVVHEFRHVGQFEKARQGVGRVLGPLFGDGALGIAAVGVPQWFFEGDAVGTETALTRSGRGRIPSFNVGLRANLLAGRRYSYQKAANGSLRDNVPDWYVLGYFMTSYLKTHHGPAIWAKVLDDYYRFPFYPFSFSNGIRRTTGLTVEQLYSRSMAEIDSTWRAQQAAQPAATLVREMKANASEKVFAQYQYPQYINDSTVLALKTGLDYIPQFVLLSRNGKERKVFTPGQLNMPEMLSVNGGKAVWPEFQQHARWGQRIASELKVLDLNTGRITRIGREGSGRYTAAALSPDGLRVVAVRENPDYHHALVIIDAQTGVKVQTLPNPRNDFYQQPRWQSDGHHIIAVALRAAGKTIVAIDTHGYPPDSAKGRVLPGQMREIVSFEPTDSSHSPVVTRHYVPYDGRIAELLPVANVNLANPQPWGDYIFYNSSQSGVDNLYAVDGIGRTYRVTSRPLGAYHAAISPDGRTLAFHDYRATGARVVEMPLNPANWTPVPAATAEAPAMYAEALTAREPAGPQVAALLAQPDSAGPRYGVRRYSPIKHAFNLFSYGVVQSPSGNAVSVGLRSQDLLNTTQLFAGLGYDQTERTFSATGALSYQGRFPVLDADVTYGGRDAAIVYQGKTYRDQWQYTRLTAGLRLPLNLTRSKYLQALTLGAYFLHEQVYGYSLPARRLSETGPNASLNAIQTTLSYATQLKRSARSVAPKWGAALLVTWRTTPFGAGVEARQWAAQGSLYLPALARNHALRLRAGYQWQNQQQYQFSAAVSIPRGEGYTSFDHLAVASLDYNLPLAFTHWELGRLLYVQRLRASVFADVAQGNDFRGTAARLNYRNVGADALVLFNVLRLRTPVEAGVRVVYRGAVGAWVVEPLAFSIRL
jgi:Tol biopolymer transport system component